VEKKNKDKNKKRFRRKKKGCILKKNKSKGLKSRADGKKKKKVGKVGKVKMNFIKKVLTEEFNLNRNMKKKIIKIEINPKKKIMGQL
jgi:hypothetical protein